MSKPHRNHATARSILTGFCSSALLSACATADAGDAGDPQPAPSPVETVASEGAAIPGDGTWEVGSDVEPGVYVAEGGESCDWMRRLDAPRGLAEGGELCMWQRLSALAPELDSVLKMGGDPRVTLALGDAAFLTTGCGAWTKTG